ncbi:hypothetical protein AV521_26440 [Streptomyces sp. IMTB 2501]|uniref:hypothetical protein n=1 Tax=Streptomyces sp. IMTB 2501 TaxID=1776340 RepID=UPI00096C7082|nr:hypothetical protein [Streptomyces sp. IMTB 2501]OLZ66933.1 hypothetical protein AV521_26440 [Streptomyces sp. IMTB 2501]
MEALRAGVAAVLALHGSRERTLERFRLLHNTASLRAGWLEKRLRFQEDPPANDGTGDIMDLYDEYLAAVPG